MKRRDYLLVGVVFAAIALNAHWIYGENGSLNADSILKAAPKGNFEERLINGFGYAEISA